MDLKTIIISKIQNKCWNKLDVIILHNATGIIKHTVCINVWVSVNNSVRNDLLNNIKNNIKIDSISNKQKSSTLNSLTSL